MIEVRIRVEDDTSAQRLAEVEFNEAALDRVIPLLSRWGVADEDGTTYDTETMIGQFKVSANGAYFEVILVSSDD